MYVKSIDSTFERCEATSKFYKKINNAFDILHSRKLYSSKPFNDAISNDTTEKYKEFTFNFCTYIEDFKMVLKFLNLREKLDL